MSLSLRSLSTPGGRDHLHSAQNWTEKPNSSRGYIHGQTWRSSTSASTFNAQQQQSSIRILIIMALNTHVWHMHTIIHTYIHTQTDTYIYIHAEVDSSHCKWIHSMTNTSYFRYTFSHTLHTFLPFIRLACWKIKSFMITIGISFWLNSKDTDSRFWGYRLTILGLVCAFHARWLFDVGHIWAVAK
jgi:hypothetical protein